MKKLSLQGVLNIRDLGGTKVQAGTIKPGRLLRSSKLSKATEEDIALLADTYQLRQIIDLRTEMERAEHPDAAVPGAVYSPVPLVTEEAFGVTRDEKSKRDLLDVTRLPAMEKTYKALVAPNTYENWRKIFDLLLTPGEGAVLWHCSEGKDRCGLTSALVLYALGASMEDIRADYLETNAVAEERAKGMYQMVLEKTGNAEIAEKVRAAFVARDAYFDSALDAMEQNCGSVDGFLEMACGLDETKRLKLKELYCE